MGTREQYSKHPIRVNKYELRETLGQGTFGKVKHAINVQTNTEVAIKILDKGKIQQQKMGNQIKREITVLKIMAHPHVVNLIEVLTSKTKIFLVLELVTGGELFQKIASSTRFDESVARLYFQQLIQGVEYCHAQGIVHRDLKPENLLLDGQGRLKISDFGLSNIVGQQGLLQTQCGTPNYVAPEVLVGGGYDGKAADVWSCGVILYVMLAGFLPFEEHDTRELFRKIKRAEFRFPSWFSTPVRDLLSHILVTDPGHRYDISRIKLDPWFRVGLPDTEAPVRSIVPTDADLEASVHRLEEGDVPPPKLRPGAPTCPTRLRASDNSLVTARSEDTTYSAPVPCVPGLAGSTPRSAPPEPGRPGPVVMNAFELISLSGALDLTPMLNASHSRVRRETWFGTSAPADNVLVRCTRAMQELRAHVQRGSQYKLKAQMHSMMGPLFVKLQIFRIAPETHIVDLRRCKGDVLEFFRFYRKLREKLRDIAPWNPPANHPALASSVGAQTSSTTR